MGQFVMVTFRVITGNVGGAAMGALVFIVGNQARCSLQASALTSFVILGYTLGTLDAIELVKHIATDRLHFFILPFQEHVITDLCSISLIMAPIAEVTGARLAWDSYLTPNMLFLPPPSVSPALTFNPAFGRQQAPIAQPHFAQEESWFGGAMSKRFQDWIPDGFEYAAQQQALQAQQALRQWTDSDHDVLQNDAGEAVALRYRRSVGGASAGSGRPSLGEAAAEKKMSSSWWPFAASAEEDSKPGDTGGPPDVAKSTREKDKPMVCSGCSEPFGSGYGRPGTGPYQNEVYCRACWDAWRS
jgi:hypothetical protein